MYENCAFTVYPSLYEGWGLPIAESFAFGKPCIASNKSSMPEVGQHYAEYFSPYNADALATLILRYSDTKYLESRTKLLQSYQPNTWDETAKAVRKFLV